jgi:hypothetical protein
MVLLGTSTEEACTVDRLECQRAAADVTLSDDAGCGRPSRSHGCSVAGIVVSSAEADT